MRAAILLGFGLAAFATSSVATADDKLGEAILGTFSYESGRRGDQDVAKATMVGSVKITKEKIYLLGPDDSEQFVISYTLDAKGDGPGKLDMTIEKAAFEDAVGSKAKGLIKAEGDTVTLIYDYSGGEPDDFDPDDGMQHRFVLKKKKQID